MVTRSSWDTGASLVPMYRAKKVSAQWGGWRDFSSISRLEVFFWHLFLDTLLELVSSLVRRPSGDVPLAYEDAKGWI